MREPRPDFLEWAKTKTLDDTLAHSDVSEPSVHEAIKSAYSSSRFQELLSEDNQWGLETLKSAISTRYGIAYDKKTPRVLLTPGASNALYLIGKTFIKKESDEVVIESPYYEPIRLAVEATKANVKEWPRKSNDFALDVEKLPDFVNKNTKVIIFSNFHNPTGIGTTREQLKKVAKIARANQTKVVVDEIYLDIAKDIGEDTQDNLPPPPSFAEGEMTSAVKLGDELNDKFFISINSLSKVYGLSRLRSGWIMGSQEVIEELRVTYKTVINIGSLDTEAISAIIFKKLDNYARRSQKIVGNNRQIMHDELSHLIDGDRLSGQIPKYSCTYFPQLPWLNKLDNSKADKMIDTLDKACGVAPGGYFGAEYHNYIRIGLGGPNDKFCIAIRNFRKTLEKLYNDNHA